jgi:hypothetical protein
MTHPRSNFGNHREASDSYRREVYRAGIWRVIVCKDGIQWILQRATRSGSTDGARWEAVSFCTTRAALLRLWMACSGEEGAPLIALLPATFRRAPGCH